MGLDLTVKINDLVFKNPIIPASGTFGFGREISEYFDLSILGGMVSKGITIHKRLGNPPIRVAQTPSGMLNSVGLQNIGIEDFIITELENFCSQDTVSIVNIAGSTLEEYVEMTSMLNETNCDIVELNLSCPNVKEGCMAFGSTYQGVYEVVTQVKKISKKPIWVKLTPNTQDIKITAKACEDSGADAVSLVNTFLGLAIDVETRRPILKNNYGGLSGPAIKPIALRMINEVKNTVDIPIVGMGGVMTGKDALEFMMAGASLVQIGTANLVNPYACKDIINEIEKEAEKLGIKQLSEVIGSLELW